MTSTSETSHTPTEGSADLVCGSRCWSFTQAFFEDLSMLAETTAWDTVSLRNVEVPKVDLFVACFECDAHSSLSIYRSQGPGSLAKGTHATAKGVLSYLAVHRPKVWLGENVKQLAAGTETTPSDLDTLRAMLLELDYELADFRIRAESHGSACPRDRTVLVSCPHRSRVSNMVGGKPEIVNFGCLSGERGNGTLSKRAAVAPHPQFVSKWFQGTVSGPDPQR